MTCHCVRAGRRCRLFSWPKDLWGTNTRNVDWVPVRPPAATGGQTSETCVGRPGAHRELEGICQEREERQRLFSHVAASASQARGPSWTAGILWKLPMVSLKSAG
ncbi:hypothetical protein INR49_031308 [Caranx melampygus]|nr:hypothetical protein INR49_031308 [Caranx melampygus]